MKTTKLDRNSMRRLLDQGFIDIEPRFFIGILDDLDSLLARCARQEELLERVNVKLSLSPIHLTIFDDLLSDLEEFRKK